MKITVIPHPIRHHRRIVEGNLHLPSSRRNAPLVIFSHGYNGNMNDFSGFADLLAENGIAAYRYNFCGGSVNAQKTLKTTEMTLFTEAEDLEAVLCDLRQHPAIDMQNVFLFGGSQGGLVTAMVAAKYRQDVKGMILLFPALCIADNWRERFPSDADIPDGATLWGMKLGRIFFESIRRFDPFPLLGEFPRDVLILHGEKDEVVPIAYSERAQKTFPHARLIAFPEEGHGFSPPGNAEAARLLLDFLKAHI